MKCETIS